MRRRVVQLLLGIVALVLAIGVGFGVWARAQLRASLPQLDGTHAIPALSADVTVTRDALGIPTIRGSSREDVARATGFLHGQDRFFQMDLARRRAAGELSALVGGRALALDIAIRMHRLRAIARQALPLMDARKRGVLDAYAGGVNSGLASLGASPFEYLVLRQTPEPWLPEDSLLVVLSMFITLQDYDGAYEATAATMHDVLPGEMAAFLLPPGTQWDAPIVGGQLPEPPIPGADVYNLRARRTGKRGIELPPLEEDLFRVSALRGIPIWEPPARRGDAAIGSNNWVVAGQLTADGSPLVANDMHLTVRVPNTWYRAVLEWPGAGSTPERHQLSGITLPGVPALVIGSNTHVAWGFTNTYADWSDIVLLELDPADPNRYQTPHGWRAFERHEEVIQVAGQESRQEAVAWTIWGPVIRPDHRGRPRALRWVAHSPERLATSVTPFEDARTIHEAFDEASRLGVPGQNMVAADRDGHIGWSIYGGIPRRVGLDGQRPASWSDGTRGWNGWLEPHESPRVIDPASGRLWTANARVVDGDMLAKLGDGSYEIGSRATIIRERLMEKERFTARDLLDIQLDTGARFLERWRGLLLNALGPRMIGTNADRARLREIVQRDWSGRASPESAGYRFTRAFRQEVSERVIRFVLAECYEADPGFDHTNLRRREAPIWKMVTEQPMHLLDPQYDSWNALLAEAIDTVIEQASRAGDLGARVWSEYNDTAYRHPLSAALPLVDRWLDMPRQALPGDLYTPRMHWGSNAASQRMVVSPGKEADGIMHMPTGQSGHPLSPFYGNSHAAWVNGEASPFLPGPAVHTLTLTPRP